MKLTSKELLKLVKEEVRDTYGDEVVKRNKKNNKQAKKAMGLEEGMKDKLVSLADQLTSLLDQIEALVPDLFNADREPAAHPMSDDEIIDQEKKFANEPPPMDE